MLNTIKSKTASVLKFMKPRAIFCLALTLALVASSLLFLGQINTFVINFSGKSLSIRTLSSDIGSVLDCAGINRDDYTIDQTFVSNGKTTVSLLRAFKVYITSGDKTVEVAAGENDTVATALSRAGYTLDEFDMVEPSAQTVLKENTYIDYVNIDYVSGSYTQAVPCSVETVYSDKLEEGQKTTTPGSDGLEKINYTQRIVNGQIAETTVDSRVTLLAAKNTVNTIGTHSVAVKTSETENCISVLAPASPIELDAAGNPVNYKKHVTVQATAYTYTGHNCATGVAPKPGYIAVNPKIIPYGTKMYIKSSDGKYVYGYAIAADTGGFINTRPTNVDLFFPNAVSMNNFGRRNVEIYILD